MKVAQKLWTIEKIVDLRDQINLNPAWQRGPAWTKQRRSLLIDSILRDMDVPKIYLHKLPSNELYKYDAVDGQQRLRAIWEYIDPNGTCATRSYPLKPTEPLPKIDGHVVQGKRYQDLHPSLKKRLKDFKVGIGEIAQASNDEITALFARLQMGMPLNPAELRNAILGPSRNLMQTMATSHEFFENTKLKNSRSKHFDFACHAFAVAAWGTSHNIKAMDLKDFQRTYDAREPDDLLSISARVGSALNVIAEVDQRTSFPITRKWIFVDLLLLVLGFEDDGQVVDIERFVRAYDFFESRRRRYTSSTELLLDKDRADSHELDEDLYQYSFAFRADGASSTSLETRNEAIAKFFTEVTV